MKKHEIEKRVIEILDDKLDLAEYPANANFNKDFGMDSLDDVEFIIDLEKRFNIIIYDDVAFKMKTINSTVDELLKLAPNEV